MRQVVCDQPDKLVFTNGEYPLLGDKEAIIKIEYVGICGTDLHAYKGRQPYFTYPRILGHELSGEIIALSSNSKGFKIGDKVSVIPYLSCGNCIACRRGKTNCCTNINVLGVHKDGGMRDFISIPLENLIKIDNVPVKEAALIEPLSIGAHAVRRSSIQKGEWCLVIGGGPIGLGIMKLAKLAGAKVIAMDIDKDRLLFCKTWAGVDEIIDAKTNTLELITNITNNDLATVVFDATGNKDSMNQALQYTSHGGRLIYVGLIKDTISFYHPDLHKKEVTIMGSRNATLQDFEHVIQHMKDGKIDISTLITHECSFEELVDQFDIFFKPECKQIKAIVKL